MLNFILSAMQVEITHYEFESDSNSTTI